MNLTVTVLEIVTLVFMLTAIGLAWVKFGFDYSIEFATRVALSGLGLIFCRPDAERERPGASYGGGGAAGFVGVFALNGGSTTIRDLNLRRFAVDLEKNQKREAV